MSQMIPTSSIQNKSFTKKPPYSSNFPDILLNNEQKSKEDPHILPRNKSPNIVKRLYYPEKNPQKTFSNLRNSNKNSRPLTAKIVNISRYTHSKEREENRNEKPDDFFILPKFSEIKPKNYPKIKKRPHSFNNNSNNSNDFMNINDRYCEKPEKKASFHIKKPLNTSVLPLQAKNMLNKSIGKPPEEIPFQPETSSINPYEMFQKLLQKSKTRSKALSFSKNVKIVQEFSFNNEAVPYLEVKDEQSSRNPSIIGDDLPKNRESATFQELSLVEESELSYIKIKTIEEFVEMLKSREIHPNEFIYLLKSRSSEAYDLKVVSYFTISRLKVQQYYTLSSKGLTLYEKGLPHEFIFLGDWLRERDQYFALKSLSFFKKFRKWKTLKKWQKLLQIRKNKRVAKLLQQNLFQIHSIYQKILLKHREFTTSIETLRFMDLNSFIEVNNLEDFAEIQRKKRRLVFEFLQVFSDKMHENCRVGLQVLMERIQTHIRSEISEDDEKYGLLAKEREKPKGISEKPAKNTEKKKGLIELLNLPDKLSYQHRNILRGECLKVLRFAYLLDFLTMESLANVYMSSLKDFMAKIEKITKSFPAKPQEISAKKPQIADPILLIKVKFVGDFPNTPDLAINEVEIDTFDITSHIQDLDLEKYVEFLDVPFDFAEKLEKPASFPAISFTLPQRKAKVHENPFIKTKRKASNVHKVWLELSPKKQEFMKMLKNSFLEGLQVLQSVRKWAKNPEFQVYANTLEDWDPIIGEYWGPVSEKQHLDPANWLKLGKYSQCDEVLHAILGTFDAQVSKTEEIRNGFRPFLDLFWRVQHTNYAEILRNEALSQPHEIFALCINFLEFSAKHCEENLREGLDFGLFHVDCAEISLKIKGYFAEINAKVQSLILEVFRERALKLRGFLLTNLKKIGNIILKIEDFIEQKENSEKIQQNLPIFKAHKEKLELIFQVISDYKMPVSKEDRDIFFDIPRYESQLSSRLQEFEASAGKTTERFSAKLSDTYIRFRAEAQEIDNELKDPLFLEFFEEIQEIITKLRALKLKTEKLSADVDKYQNFALKLQVKGHEELEELEKVKKNVEIKLLLWQSLSEWSDLAENWEKTSFFQLNPEALGESSEKYWKLALHCEKNLSKNAVLDKYKGEVSDFKELLPIISSLKSPFLKNSHWAELYRLIFLEFSRISASPRRVSKNKQEKIAFFLEKLGQTAEFSTNSPQKQENLEAVAAAFSVDSEKSLKNMLFHEKFTLSHLIQMNLLVYKEEIVEISFKAQQESVFEQKLAILQQNFEEKELKIKTFAQIPEILVLCEAEELFQALDETLSSINLLLSSKYSNFVKSRAETLQKNVMFLQELLENWLECQGKWLYFSRIFAMSEVRRDLISQVSGFETSDKTLKLLMKRLELSPSVGKVLRNVGLNEKFVKFLEAFAKLQKDLESYLDAKRAVFARLCFLSNEELLDLLSKSQEIDEIQPFLLKIFDNVAQIQVNPSDNAIVCVKSQEFETLSLKKLAFFKGSLEVWLENLQNSVQDSLRKQFRSGLQESLTANLSRIELIDREIGQISSVLLMIHWTMAIETVFSEKNGRGLEELYEISLAELEKTIAVLKKNASFPLLLKLKNQVMFDLFSRDLLQKLIFENVADSSDFFWQETLRIYHDFETNEIIVKQLSFNFSYCFEYQGLKPRLVITPLTSRCFLTISTSFVEGLGVSLWGPAGTGKTETVKELAKFCGVFCLVFNCSEQISYKTLSQLVVGLVSQGVWGCLDEFNRLSVDVLYLVWQTILTIRMAWVSKLNEIDLEGKITSFKRKSFGFCITMNPGYQARNELPENLKSLLRPIYMLVPNSEIIAEVLLISQGFFQARELSAKVVALYHLCEEQLVSRKNYDFGLRALKSVLLAVKSLEFPKETEEFSLVRALKQANLGKLLPQDAEVFLTLLSDVFPGHEETEESLELQRNSLKSQHLSAFQSMSLPYDAHFSAIIHYIQGLLPLRFGIILLGPSKTGKTTVLKLLSAVENSQISCLNPKSMALPELFGYFSRNGEWKEGLASSLIKLSLEKTVAKPWISFDGPIESSWIENLNSVLDDNRTLCLANSERIRLNENSRFFFETDHLKDASPATISRCGIAYFPYYRDLWVLVFETWALDLQSFRNEDFATKNVDQETAELVKELGLKLLRDGFEVLKAFLGRENVEIACVKGVCNVFEMILNREEVDLQGENLRRRLNYIWAYAFLWGACAVFAIPANKLEHILKEAFKNLLFPFTENLYNLRLDPYDCSSFTVFPAQQSINFPQSPHKQQFFAPITELQPYIFIIGGLISYKKGLMVLAPSGSCKTTLISHIIASFSPENKGNQAQSDQTQENGAFLCERGLYFPAFHACAPKSLQNFIEKSLHKKNKSTYGASPGKVNVFFIDDVNLMEKEEKNRGVGLEFLREMLENRGFYDHNRLEWKNIEDLALIASYSQDFAVFSTRFVNNLQIIHLEFPNNHYIQSIFQVFLNELFAETSFSPDIKAMKSAFFDASLELFRKVQLLFKPTPRKFSYQFSLKDLKNLVFGLFSLKNNPFFLTQRQTVVKAWIHEVCREFSDRFNEENDRQKLEELLKALSQQFFQLSLDFKLETLCFSDFAKAVQGNSQAFVEEVKDFKKMQRIFEEKLVDHAIKFVFSEEIVVFLLRTMRILRLPGSFSKHLLVLGQAGSGKRSLCKISAFLCDIQVWEPNTTSLEAFNDDFKRFLLKILTTNATFLLIFNESCLDSSDIFLKLALLLNSQTPNQEIYENFEELLAEALKISKNKGNSLFLDFKARVSVALCAFSEDPRLGNLLKTYKILRLFQGILNVSPWSTEALLNVAHVYLENQREIARLLVEIHQIAENETFAHNQQNKAKIYCSPTHFLEILSVFKAFSSTNHQALQRKIKALSNGLEKLDASQALVATLSRNLSALEPQLLVQSEKIEEICLKLANDHEKANEKELLIMQETQAMNVEKESFQKLWTEAQNDLDLAIPLLKEAEIALNALKKYDIAEIRTFNNPPPIVLLVMEAVCVLLEEKTDWNSIKVVMTDIEFLPRLIALEKEKIKESTIKKLRVLLSKPEFDPDSIGQKSLACKSLALWCKAIENYYKIERITRPKKQRVNEMRRILDEKDQTMQQKTKELQSARAKLSLLQSECDTNLALRQQVLQEIEKTRVRLANSEKLIALLSSEEDKWQKLLEKMQADLRNLQGDTLLLSACLVYYGPFSTAIREELLEKWTDRLYFHDIKLSSSFNWTKMLFKDTEIGKWTINGLPHDEKAVENASLILKTPKNVVIVVDPENTAFNWLKNSGFLVFSEQKTDKTQLFFALSQGKPALFDEFSEPLEETLSIITEKKLVFVDGTKSLVFSEGIVAYNEDFRLILCTKKPKLAISSSLFLKTSVINFQITYQGLSEQLLSLAISLEMPKLEQKFNEITTNMNKDQENLALCEERILNLLDKPSEINILDDSELLQTLQTSKLQSEEIQKNLAQSLEIEREIVKTREIYQELAGFGASLYFTLKGLVNLSPIYYYSLEWFKKVYEFAFKIKEFQDSQQRERRVKRLFKEVHRKILEKAQFGLFYRHRPVFAILTFIDYERRKGFIPENLWELFVKGKTSAQNPYNFGNSNANNIANFDGNSLKKQPSWVKDSCWSEILSFSALLKSDSQLIFLRNFFEKPSEWKKFIENPLIHSVPQLKLRDFGALVPENSEVKGFEMLIKAFFIKVFRPDYLLNYFNSFISSYLSVPVHYNNEIEQALSNIDCKTPLLIIAAAGLDPIETLLKYSRERRKTFQLLSLSSGNKKLHFSAFVEKAREIGSWILMQNCHLTLNELAELRKCLEIDSFQTHPEFRIVLTTSLIDNFPINFLNVVFKYVFEKQQSLKMLLTETVSCLNNEEIEQNNAKTTKKTEEFGRYFFILCIFHSLVKARSNFCPIGFSKPYEFNLMDFESSKNIVKRALNSKNEIEDCWDSIFYLIGNINYGGRINDDIDLSIVLALLKRCFLEYDDKLSRKFSAKPIENLSMIKKIVENFNEQEDSEIYGFNQNAFAVYKETMAQTLISDLNKEPVFNDFHSRTTIKAQENAVLTIISEILKGLPKKIDISEKMTSCKTSALFSYIIQEARLYNKIIRNIIQTCENVKKTIEDCEQTSESDLIIDCLYNYKVPSKWKDSGFISSKELPQWLVELKKKTLFINDIFNDNGLIHESKAIWLGAFINPRNIFNCILQDFARAKKVAFNKVGFKYEVEDFSLEKSLQSKEFGSIYIMGLYLEAAQWDAKQETLVETTKSGGNYFNEMPLIQVIPYEINENNDNTEENFYLCPLMKTHKQILSQKDNFIGYIELKNRLHSNNNWILKGVALLTQIEF